MTTSLGQTATVNSTFTQPASGYAYYDGTSMATPHASAVAALVWSSKPTATNAEIRTALQSSALDLGTAGRDNSYGYGLVQAKAAITALGGGGGSSTKMSVKDLDATKTLASRNWTAKVTITIKDVNGVAVSGAKVTGKFSSTSVSCTTGSSWDVHRICNFEEQRCIRYLHRHQRDRHELHIRCRRQQRSGWRQQRHEHYDHEVDLSS